ncbi:hypothetical protein SxD43FB_12490 [Sphingobium sp. D43FB]|nr:hypothetical protein SxD43FB_12490 [Sphingobium sp. D43FB]
MSETSAADWARAAVCQIDASRTDSFQLIQKVGNSEMIGISISLGDPAQLFWRFPPALILSEIVSKSSQGDTTVKCW